MSGAAPEISVIIPVYNGEKYLAESIRSAMNQQRADVEILVVDNGSTDATPAVARMFPSARYLRLEQRGLAKALNYGVEQSQGAFIAFLDADDLWTPDKLSIQLEATARNAAIDMVFGHVEQFISPELADPAKERLHIRDKRLPGRVKSTLLIRKKSFSKVGPFEESLDFADFIDWYMRAEERKLKELMLPDVLALRRIHGGNLGYTDRDKRVEYVRAIKRGLDRRRYLRQA